MTTATPAEQITKRQPLAAAGGDHRTQLAHLKAHLKFQNQGKYEQLRLNWATVITREQSRRHITLHLNQKINAKSPGFYRPGKTNTEDGQATLRSTVSHAMTGIHHGGHVQVQLSWRLRYRIYRASKPKVTERGFWELTNERRPAPLRPKEEGFPEEIKTRHALRERVKEMIKRQGANPAKHKDAIIMEIYACKGCRNLYLQEEIEDGRCPVCIHSLQEDDLMEAAFDPGSPPSIIAPRRRRSEGQERKAAGRENENGRAGAAGKKTAPAGRTQPRGKAHAEHR